MVDGVTKGAVIRQIDLARRFRVNSCTVWARAKKSGLLIGFVPAENRTEKWLALKHWNGRCAGFKFLGEL